MPKVSEFFGIAIYLYYREHSPPHFHALYAGEEVLVRIDDFSVLAGRIGPRAMGLVVEWASQHQDELRQVWQQAADHQPLDKIEPLK